MNVIEILWKLGWDVLSFDGEGEYKIQLGKARRELTDKQIKEGIIGYVGSTSDIITVKVGDVGFNGLGNLYVEFRDIDTGDIIDAFEYRNMAEDELFI